MNITRYVVEVTVTVDVNSPLSDLPEDEAIDAIERSLHEAIDTRGWTYQRCQAVFRGSMVTDIRPVMR